MCQVLGLAQEGGGCRDYWARILLHGAYGPVGNNPITGPSLSRAEVERWEGPGRRKGSEVRTWEDGRSEDPPGIKQGRAFLAEGSVFVKALQARSHS